MAFVAGQYTATLAAATVGQIEQGINISHSFNKQMIVGNNMGSTIQDGCFQGADMTLEYRLMEYNAASARAAFWPYGTTYMKVVTLPGMFDVQNSLFGALILTALTGTPAATLGPASITIPRSIIRENFNVQMLLDTTLRVIPIQMRAYPAFGTGAEAATLIFGTLT